MKIQPSRSQLLMLIGVALLISFSPRISQAQWTTTGGGDATNNNSSGKVGIGTSSPDQRLTLNAPTGALMMSWRLNDITKAYFGIASAPDSVVAGSAAGDLGFRAINQKILFSVDNGSSAAMTLNTYGNLGIGTTNANLFDGYARLSAVNTGAGVAIDVAGNGFSRIHLRDTSQGTDQKNWELLNWNSAFSISRINDPSTARTTYFTLTNAGSIGMGMSPASSVRLDVQGSTADSSGYALRASNSGLTNLFAVRNDGNVGIGTIGPAYKLDVNGEINATGLRINGTPIATGGSSQWNNGSGSIYYTGNVGIGTTSPQRTLDLGTSGQLTFGNNGYSSTGSPGLFWYVDNTNYGIYKSAGAWSGPNYQQLNLNFPTGIVIDGGYAYGRSGTVLQPNGGNVGVGTTTPASKLLVDTTTPDSAVVQFRQFYNTPGHSFGAFIRGGTNAADYNLALRDANDVDLVRVLGNGNVGIATITPGYKLDVNGEINATGLRINGTPIATGGSQWNNGSGSIYYTGNVGIGTSTPGTKLDVAGNIQAAGTLKSTGGADGYLFLDGSAGGEIQFTRAGSSRWAFGTDVAVAGDDLNLYSYTGSAVRMTVLNSNGNVGIGTSSPGAKLHVNGGIYGEGQIRANALSLFMWGTDAGGTNRVLGGAPNIESQDPQGLELGTSGSTPLVLYTGAAERLRIDGSGTTSVTGNMTVSGSLAAKYQDVAEWVPSSAQLAAGTVVVLDPTKSNQVTSSSVSYDTRVAGVVSAQPGIALGEKGDSKVLVATTGRVRVKVDATKNPIHIGDLLVTSDVPGVAMKSEPVEFAGRRMHMPGTLIGKALEPLEKGTGEILVLLSLQ